MSGETMAADEANAECGSSLLLGLPEDVLELISGHLQPRDLCSLALCCRGLRAAVAASEKAWLAQCRRLGPPPDLLPRWRSGVQSYSALCHFLSAVSPLLGIWVHQNPELGNVVCVLWGFLSVAACRVIPQELGPLGLDGGPLLWAPVFEILADFDGAPSLLFLHGRDLADDSLFPGVVRSLDAAANVLLLEVDARPSANPSPPSKSHLLPHSRSFSAASEPKDPILTKTLCRSDTTVALRPSPPPAPPPLPAPFSRLAFGDRRRLLDLVAGKVRLKVPQDLAAAPLFPCSSTHDDIAILADRRLSLIQMHKLNGGRMDRKVAESSLGLSERSRIRRNDEIPCSRSTTTGRRRNLFSVAKDGLKQVMRRSSSSLNSAGLISRNRGSSGSSESKHVPVDEFLRTGDMIGLNLRAAHMRLSTYRAWPNMHDNRFALYKLPLLAPEAGREYAGLWGGTFGWPPGRPSEDKPGKALFFLLLSYEEAEGQLRLIATKILEGTHYVLHPNGSAMFTVKVDEPATEPFPWETYGDSIHVEVQHTCSGEGIASGYGFRYPGSKPGSLYVIQNGLLAFVWRESKAVLTLQRLDLEELLKKGERVPSLPPIDNFAYLTKSYSNVFAGLPSNSSCSTSPRQYH
ncbi:F-box protein At5g39450 [Elaeis guineensis]|uniref:F-box protein At5g39450 n=1 Tax=Elaeis guineensis var. tenera TaxID=51953 RepID=A0A6I9QKI1_ELAGV|nr:F-box protein At5g39450 [Elaeis guineensis]